jgi:hypothetical protein
MRQEVEVRRLFAICGMAALLVCAASCSANERAKNWGGTATKELPPGMKLIGVTWKEESLWYTIRPMRPGEAPETYEFVEDAAWAKDGKVIIKESAAQPQ